MRPRAAPGGGRPRSRWPARSAAGSDFAGAVRHPRGMEDVPVTATLTIPAGELLERFSRSSGPGGQSVNTADSRVELSFDVERSAALPGWARDRITERLAGRLAGGVLTVAASEQRSQLANRQGARARLGALLRVAVAPPRRPRVPTRPGRAANERRLEAKRQRAAVKRGRRSDRTDPD